MWSDVREFLDNWAVDNLMETFISLNPDLRPLQKSRLRSMVENCVTVGREGNAHNCLRQLRSCLVLALQNCRDADVTNAFGMVIKLLPLEPFEEPSSPTDLTPMPLVDTMLREKYQITTTAPFGLAKNRRRTLLQTLESRLADPSLGGIICPITWEALFDPETRHINDDVVVIFEEEYFDEEPPVSFANSFRATSSAGYNYTFATSTLDSLASNMYHAIQNGKRLIDRLVGAEYEDQLFPFASRNNALMNGDEPVFFPCGTVGIGSSVEQPIPLVSDSFGCPFELSPITRSRTIVEARTYIDARSKVRRKWIVTPSGGSTEMPEVAGGRAVRIGAKAAGSDEEDVENNSPNIYCHFFKGTALINWFDTGNVINPMTRQLVVIIDFCRLSNIEENSDPMVDIWGHKRVTVS